LPHFSGFIGNQGAAMAENVTALRIQVELMESNYNEALDTIWMLVAALLVFFMHAGFSLLEAGCVRFKNTQNILAKNLIVVTVGFLSWWALGWGFAYAGYELIGAALAAAMFRVVRPDEFGGESEYGLGTKLCSEFLGTFFLVLTVGLNVLGGSAAPVWSIAASLMCMIFALGSVSGGHFNPAVTVAVFVSKRPGGPDAKMSGMYIGTQLAGGLAGALTYVIMEKGHRFPLGPGKDYDAYQAYLAELLFTFLLCFVVLCVATVKDKDALTEFFALAIGSCVTVGGYAIGAISGGSLNPAVSFGIATTGYDGLTTLLHCIVYIIVELCAGAMAAGLFMVTHPEEEYVKKEDAGEAAELGKAK